MAKAVQVTMYEGPNGKLYSTEAQAEYFLQLISFLEHISEIWYDDISSENVAEWLFENYTLIKKKS